MLNPERDIADRRLRLLVATDAKAKRDAVIGALEQAGHRVDVVSDGTRAVRAVMREVYDAVLIDIRMRNMDGVQTASAIRDLPGEMSDVPVVALATEMLPDCYERYLMADAETALSVPSGHEELFAALDALIAKTAPPPHLPEDGGEILDRNVLGAIRRMDAEDTSSVFGDIIALFLDTAPLDMARLLDAIEARDLSQVEAVAHKLTTSCANVGALRLSDALGDVLVLAQCGDVGGIIARRDVLCRESDRAYRALEEML